MDSIRDVFDLAVDMEVRHNKGSEECCLCNSIITDTSNSIRMPGNGFICERCAEYICNAQDKHMINENEHEEQEAEDVPFPSVIYEYLCQHVVGQDEAKKVISVAAYNHYKRGKINNSDIKKSNVLLIGNTGSGKTLMVSKLADILKVPFVSFSATSFTENGYIGDDVDKCISDLYLKSGENVLQTERGIVFIDEIDKLSECGRRDNGGYVVGKGGVQQAFLTLLEGRIVNVSGRGYRNVPIDTSNILFICAGSFAGIEDIIEKRLRQDSSIGFGAQVSSFNTRDYIRQVTFDDLHEFGMMREFLGRFSGLGVLDDMSVELLKDALVKPKNSILWQYQELFAYDGIELVVEDAALTAIAKRAFDLGVGCRGLRRICEQVFTYAMFACPGKNVTKVIFKSEHLESGVPEVIYGED